MVQALIVYRALNLALKEENLFLFVIMTISMEIDRLPICFCILCQMVLPWWLIPLVPEPVSLDFPWFLPGLASHPKDLAD